MADEHSEIGAQFPVLALRSAVMLPGEMSPLEVGRRRSVRAVDEASRDDGLLLVVPQLDPEVDEPGGDDLCMVGVAAEVVEVTRHGRNHYTVMARGIERHRVLAYSVEGGLLMARTGPVVSTISDLSAVDDLMAEVKEHVCAIAVEQSEAEEVHATIWAIENPDDLVDLACTHVELERDDELALLCETDSGERLRRVLGHVARLHEVIRVTESIRSEFMVDISGKEREKVLRERLKYLSQQLGESDADEVGGYFERIANTDFPEEPRAAARREASRMSQMSPSSSEYNVSRTYLEWLLDLPWGKCSEDSIDVAAARAILDADHAGLEKVKKRILEFIAVRKLAPHKQGPILCLVGPPGVGKTSLGRGIATALGRKYVRAALGGVQDDSAIRGHRRTYVGSLPGRIVSSLKKAGAMNPVFVLDEIDKLGNSQRGDPGAALLEVLDPEHNNAFIDHYLEVPLDLSKVMFIATANQLGTIPTALLDRLEVIRIPGYTSAEKLTIGTKHLLPKQMAEHGLAREQLTVADGVLSEIIAYYTREAGVRNLEREIASVCRSAAVGLANGDETNRVIQVEDLADILGPRRFFSEEAETRSTVGVATGLSWRATGGQVMFVEVRKMPGEGRFRVTGEVGDIMSEAAQAAVSWVRTHAQRFGIASDAIASWDLHMHVPTGGMDHDGASAGITLVTALVSCLTNKPSRSDVAMTGEISLRGIILEVSGVKEKVLAAHAAGIKVLFVPERNRRELEDVPVEIREELDIRLVRRVDEVLAVALGSPEALWEIPAHVAAPLVQAGSAVAVAEST